MNDTVAGARCARHPERQAQGICKRCGNFACAECDAAGFDSGTVCITCAQTVVSSRYHVVPAWRFALFNVLTFNAYSVYWFWKTWSQIKRADGSDIWPIPRAIFAGFTYFSLLTDINTQLTLRRIPRELSTGLGIGFLALGAFHRLPDPYWLISVAAFAFVLPTVKAIEALASANAIAEGAAWRTRHTILLLITIPWYLLAAIGAFLPNESTPL